MPLGELLQLLPTLRPTTAEEWTVVERRAMENQAESQSATGGDVARVPVGGGTPRRRGILVVGRRLESDGAATGLGHGAGRRGQP